MSTYLSGIDCTIHPEDEMLLNAISGLSSVGLARAVYFRQGHEINQTLKTIHGWVRAKNAAEAAPKILDFACGHGRATRFLVAEVDPSQVWVSDIYPSAVDFQKAQFGVNGFLSCYEPDELQCDERFDLIFVASLFTHLPRQRFEQWLRRLHGLLSPRGVLAFSVHDEALAKGRQVPADGLLFVPESESRSLDLNEYGATYVAERYVADAIRRVTGHPGYRRLPTALCGSHDMYLVSRDPNEDFADFAFVQPPVGYVDWFSLSPEGVFRIGGWVGEHDPAQSIDGISISVGGRRVGELKPHFPREDVAAALGKPHFRWSGWDFSMPGFGSADRDGTTVEVVARSTSGLQTILHASALADASAPMLPPQSTSRTLLSRAAAAVRRSLLVRA